MKISLPSYLHDAYIQKEERKDVQNKSYPRLRVFRWEPKDRNEWFTLNQGTDETNLGHAPEWFVVIRQSYGHLPLYLRIQDEQNHAAVLPAFFIRRFFGSVVTSMPFLDTGGPCGSSPALTRLLIESLREHAKRLRASHIELRCIQPLDLPVPASRDKVSLVLPVCDDPNILWKNLNAKVRNQIRKAERSGLVADIGGKEKLAEFFTVFSINMRDLGSPVHSKLFFESLLDAFGNKARIVIVRDKTVPVAGLVAIAIKDTVFVPWASALKQYRPLCPNMLLYWETIRKASIERFRKFDFGRSSRNSSTYQFKKQWGAKDAQLYWYTIPVYEQPDRTTVGNDWHKAIFSRLWRHLPLSMTQQIGPYIRKNITL
jgi:serine/alanine adding enzyme